MEKVNYSEKDYQDSTNQENTTHEQIMDSLRSRNFVYAGFLLRLVAAFIDGILFLALSIILGFITKVNLSNFLIEPTAIRGVLFISSFFFYMIFLLVFYWLYFALMESSSKQGTIGKIIVGIKVSDLNGQRINFLRASKRYFPVKFIIPFVLLLMGFQLIAFIFILIANLMIIFTEKKQGLQDIIAGCLVIRK